MGRTRRAAAPPSVRPWAGGTSASRRCSAPTPGPAQARRRPTRGTSPTATARTGGGLQGRTPGVGGRHAYGVSTGVPGGSTAGSGRTAPTVVSAPASTAAAQDFPDLLERRVDLRLEIPAGHQVELGRIEV